VFRPPFVESVIGDDTCNDKLVEKGLRMDKNLIAKASVTINAPNEKVSDALVNPEAIKQYMSGTNVVAD
jgi:hypothetical protein